MELSLNVPLYMEVHRERERAHAKHDANGGSMERKTWDYPGWLPVVAEEFRVDRRDRPGRRRGR